MQTQLDTFAEYHLVSLRRSLCAKLKIAKVNGSAVETRPGIVCVDAIGGGGLKFVTDLKLPTIPTVEYSIEMTLANRTLFLPAYLFHKEEFRSGLHEYSARFVCEESIRSFIISVANRLELKRYYDVTLKNCSGCPKSAKHECPTKSLRESKRANVVSISSASMRR